MKVVVHVIPNASHNSIVQIEDGSFKVRLTASPVDGKANEALVKLLATHFHISKSRVQIVRGFTGRKKVVEIVE
jgi:uncharacterized protein (TIGR00251 family)